ncbi:MAG: sel1 repeat family protein [Hyphomicrobiales bacterium]|nr:sel1 repeat family protein [Hyphomicrobiales bacterium]
MGSGRRPGQADLAAGKAAYAAGDYAAAERAWRPLAEAGDAEAQYWLGDLYRFGLGRPVDFKAALRWQTRAARQGHVMAIYALGYMAEEGQGTARDLEKAECLYRVAAENGYANAQYALYVIRRHDYNRLDWCERAAEQGQAKALTRLGWLGLMNPFSDDVEAYKLLILGADRGNKHAAEELARAMANTDQMVQRQLAEARRRAAKWSPVLETPPSPPVPVPASCWPG